MTALKKHVLNLREGDWDYITSMYANRGIPTSVVIRTLVSKFVDERRATEPETDVQVEVKL